MNRVVSCKRSNLALPDRDCFGASRLAMTGRAQFFQKLCEEAISTQRSMTSGLASASLFFAVLPMNYQQARPHGPQKSSIAPARASKRTAKRRCFRARKQRRFVENRIIPISTFSGSRRILICENILRGGVRTYYEVATFVNK
jgi:hypothetical protein